MHQRISLGQKVAQEGYVSTTKVWLARRNLILQLVRHASLSLSVAVVPNIEKSYELPVTGSQARSIVGVCSM